MVIAANVIDFLAALIQVSTGAVKKKSRILIMQIVQLIMQGVAMLLLGGVTGAVSNVLSCVRNYICYKEKLNLPWKIFFIAASIVMTILLNDQGLLGIIPAAVCTVYIIFMDIKDPIKFKILVMLTFIPWCIYHFVLGSYTGAIFDAVTIITNLFTIVRMKKG
ncbi:YgjV family protein [Butyrivibrio sp. VCB2006]|uniref:YgjV family protein n=1 Tax=Butyrivibrio sp. VCB2006 TaxID=1280679 RepID=UPI000403BF73|nr:YgjV family protein [Butyrivibrio sp. VCB2006]